MFVFYVAGFCFYLIAFDVDCLFDFLFWGLGFVYVFCCFMVLLDALRSVILVYCVTCNCFVCLNKVFVVFILIFRVCYLLGIVCACVLFSLMWVISSVV